MRPDLCCRDQGLQPLEAAPILDVLVGHIAQPAFTCGLRWEDGVLVV